MEVRRQAAQGWLELIIEGRLDGSFQFVIERSRKPGEIDRFHWYCANCDNFLHEETYVVSDYKADPVTRAYENYYRSLEARTCKKCGTVEPAPDKL